MGYWGMSWRRLVVVSLVVGLVATACAMSDDDTADVAIAGSNKDTSSEVAMPSGRYTGEWPDDPADFANNHLATGSFEVITIEVSGSSWTVETSYSTTIPVGGNCFSTVTHTISGDGSITVDSGGPNLMGEVPDRWARERGGDGCPNPTSEAGETLASVFLTHKDGLLDGWIEGHNITLVGD